MTVKNTLADNVNVKVSIADGATVTLQNATINGTSNPSYKWAGITCVGNATLTLDGINNVTGFYDDYPGVYIEPEKTLTIQGSGTLYANSNGWGTGIGGGYEIDCGNIVINSGTIIATGGDMEAGIGGGSGASCGYITINNGDVTATGGIGGAGIGAAFCEYPYAPASCGAITINGGAVTATGGKFAAGIGSGCAYTNGKVNSTCGNITISGGTVVAVGGNAGWSDDMDLDIQKNENYVNRPIVGGAGIGTGSSGGNFGSGSNFKGKSNCGTITIGIGVTSVTATKGSDAVNSIGLNNSAYNAGSCGTITIAPGANVTQN